VAVLTVENLSVVYRSDDRLLRAVQGVSFEVRLGEVLGLVGESGSGKSTVGRALLRLLPRNGEVVQGAIDFDGHDLVTISDREMRRLRWDRIAMVFQGAMKVLDPVYTVGSQIVEAIRTHRSDVGRRQAWKRAEELLVAVGIDPSRARAFPHELSGGMKQRVNIAMAIALDPELIIADEPTTALDVISQDNVMARLLAMQQEHGSAMILISHDMGLIAENCDRVAVMYAGRIVESGTVEQIFEAPSHPYTMGLINAIPELLQRERLVAIPGFPPSAAERLDGCYFAARCPFRQDRCDENPPWVEVEAGHHASCHFTDERDRFRQLAKLQATWDVAERRTRPRVVDNGGLLDASGFEGGRR
jgi:peptide/nickel transport system ATP-binding protein